VQRIGVPVARRRARRCRPPSCRLPSGRWSHPCRAARARPASRAPCDRWYTTRQLLLALDQMHEDAGFITSLVRVRLLVHMPGTPSGRQGHLRAGELALGAAQAIGAWSRATAGREPDSCFSGASGTTLQALPWPSGGEPHAGEIERGRSAIRGAGPPGGSGPASRCPWPRRTVCLTRCRHGRVRRVLGACGRGRMRAAASTKPIWVFHDDLQSQAGLKTRFHVSVKSRTLLRTA